MADEKRYMGLRKQLDKPRFSSLTPHTVIRMTIEGTRYSRRPHRLIIWSEHELEPKPITHFLLTDDDLNEIYQTIKDRVNEGLNNANKKNTKS